MADPTQSIVLCPGQGAQAVGMGKAWYDASAAARAVFDQADETLGDVLGQPLSTLCFEGPADVLNRTNISQPAIYVCSTASFHGLVERHGDMDLHAAAGLSLGEYTALHLAGVFSFEDGLRLVARRGELMQQAAEASDGGMIALIGANEQQAEELCRNAADGDVLVPANFNAPGQIVCSGHAAACQRAVEQAEAMGLRAQPLTVAGAFHSPLMQPAADQMADALAKTDFAPPRVPVWANVMAQPHHPDDMEQMRNLLVQQIVSPVRWAETCRALADQTGTMSWIELAPGTVLRGLMRRIERSIKVINHDAP